ncbi:hypothetical protein [Novosphingobium sp.]|uniref:hypothetical protein n=1 Tax=Novosphingobium sp. TaxID=1874826 RepID=UPI00273595F1|nr:hypothetical protein [Novosphingobium sp.]MDP3905913.1 hypothetical protein [Novosphingobium sp.]
MNESAKLELIMQSLERASERLGDITHLVFKKYYEKFPDARRDFNELSNGNVDALEGEMVERVIYTIMTWFESPGEIEIQVSGSAAHHKDTLNINEVSYIGLIVCVIDAIKSTIPHDKILEFDALASLEFDICNIVNSQFIN